jgi:hypothetical protein
VRVEGAAARWDVRRTVYDPDAGFQVTDDRSIGTMSARHLVALLGVRAGREPVCAHVSVGGGLYSMAFGGATLRRAGVAIAAGVEVPTGERGFVQADATVHIITMRDGTPITSMSAVPALSLLIGWAYRF